MLTIFIAAAAGFIVATVTTRALASSRSPLVVLDHPNDRSLHDIPTPRTGGLGIVSGIVAGVGVMIWAGGLPPREMLWTMAAALGVAIVSFCDDLWTLPPLVRFLLQISAAATLVVGAGLALSRVSVPFAGAIELAVAAAPLTILFIVWAANLYNFMDGMDGLAGGMTVAGFGVLAAVAEISGDAWMAGICVAVAASAAGFLVFNMPPARIFMGDVGSVPLGFLAGAIAVRSNQTGAADIWASVLVFSPFIIDATVVVLRRLARGERVWEAHRTHWYQRLLLAGWPRRRTLAAEYILMLCAGASALVYVRAGDPVRLAIAIGWTVAYGWFHRTVNEVECHSQRHTSNPAAIR